MRSVRRPVAAIVVVLCLAACSRTGATGSSGGAGSPDGASTAAAMPTATATSAGTQQASGVLPGAGSAPPEDALASGVPLATAPAGVIMTSTSIAGLPLATTPYQEVVDAVSAVLGSPTNDYTGDGCPLSGHPPQVRSVRWGDLFLSGEYDASGTGHVETWHLISTSTPSGLILPAGVRVGQALPGDPADLGLVRDTENRGPFFVGDIYSTEAEQILVDVDPTTAVVLSVRTTNQAYCE